MDLLCRCGIEYALLKCAELRKGVLGFWGPQLIGLEKKFYVLYVTETCKICALAAAEIC